MDKFKLGIDRLTISGADTIVLGYLKSIDGLKKYVSIELFEKIFTLCGGNINFNKMN